MIEHECNAILQPFDLKNNSERWQRFLDTVGTELEKHGSESFVTMDLNILSTIVTTLTRIDKESLEKSPEMKNHRLWKILCDYLIEFLFDQKRITLILDLSILFHNVYVASVKIDHLVALFLRSAMTDQICSFFKQIEVYSEQTELVTVIDSLMHIYQRVLKLIPDPKRNQSLKDLFESITQCMNSSFFITLLERTIDPVPLSEVVGALFFDTCIEFLYWQPYEDDDWRRNILQSLSNSIAETLRARISATQNSELLLRLYCLLSLNVLLADGKDEPESIDRIFYQITDNCIGQLTDETSPSVQRTILEILCHLTHDLGLTVHMKENPSLKERLLKLSNVEDGEISFDAYRILSMVMTEQDIKSLENATKIVGIYYLYTISMLDDPVQKSAFLNLLHSLKCKYLSPCLS